MQIKFRRASLARPSDRSSAATRPTFLGNRSPARVAYLLTVIGSILSRRLISLRLICFAPQSLARRFWSICFCFVSFLGDSSQVGLFLFCSAILEKVRAV